MNNNIHIVIILVAGFILTLFFFIGIIRFARTGRTGEAFHFRATKETIGRIGWGNYIFALIIVLVLVIIVETVLASIPFIGILFQVVCTPLISVFMAGYVCLVYDSAEDTADLQAVSTS